MFSDQPSAISLLLFLSLVVLYYDVEQVDGAILHFVNQPLNEREDIVVEQLENHSDDQTEKCSQQSDLDTTGNNGSGDITHLLDFIERLDHTDDGTQESERRSDSDEECNPREVLLEETELNATIGSDRLLNYIDTLVVAAETLIED